MAINISTSCELPVFYATTEGQTRRIAERLAATLRDRGIDSWAIDLAQPGTVDWTRVCAVLLGASIHIGRHQAEAAAFIDAHAARLNAVPSAFFSVSLSAASSDAREVAVARRLAEEFPAAHGWMPSSIASFAGCLAYSKYGFFKRLLMKRIARKEGAPTDSSRDYELTDWQSVERLACELAAIVKPHTVAVA